MPNEGFFNPGELLDQLGVGEGMLVADFGCGAGEVAIMMARRVGASGLVTALDVLPEVIESLRGKADAEGLHNVHIGRANLEIAGSTMLRDNSQQLVYLGNILWQTNKKLEVLQEAVRVTAPSGSVVAVEWMPGVQGFGPPEDLRISGEKLKKIILQAGLEVERSFPAGAYHYGVIAKKHA